MKAILACVPLLALAGSGVCLEYEDDIMPFLVKKCGECHSDESGKAKGGLKLDDPKHLQARFEKNSLVVPGDWDASYLFIVLYRPEGHDDAMPPKGKGERLTQEETDLVQQWITEGAPINGTRGEQGEMPKETKPQPEPSLTSAEQEKEWTNIAGKTISATLVRVEGNEALLRMKGGKVYRYPIDQLSEESRKQLKN